MKRWWMVLGLVLAFGNGVAQPPDPGPGKEGAPAAPQTAEIENLLLALAEINWLNNVNPLKLTPEQCDKLMEANQRAKKRLEQIFQEEAKELLTHKETIRKMRDEAREGKAVPKSFIDQMSELEKKSAQRRLQLRLDVVRGIGNELKPIFTKEQMEYIHKRSREVLKEMKIEKADDDQAYWFFFENVLLTDAASVLLKELKAKAAK